MKNKKNQNSSHIRLLSNLDQPESTYVEQIDSQINYTVIDEEGIHSGSVPVINVDSIHFETAGRKAASSLIWAALSILLGLICYLIIENTVLQIASVSVCGAMALYLVYGNYSEAPKTELIICTSLAEIRLMVTGTERERDILKFTKSVFDYKSSNDNTASYTQRVFSPR